MLSLRFFLRSNIIRILVIVVALHSIIETLRIRARLPYHVEPEHDIHRRPERIYIASLHWNDEKILRDYWSDSVLALAKAIGRDNVYVSIYESGSWDKTKDVLRDLDKSLGDIGVKRNITFSNITHAEEISQMPKSGWVYTVDGKKEMRRIPYLSRIRNLSLEPLETLAMQGQHFDKVLFLNDVIFSTNDVLRLLDTNGGDYAAACSMDFSKAPYFYDTFALRDSEGHEAVMQTWPYFRSRDSRHAIKQHRPIPVTSCWNGIVAMSAQPFISNPPLRFRGIDDSLAAFHVEGSECCLIHFDNPLSHQKGIYVNPDVRVGYNREAYNAVHPKGRFLSSTNIFISLWKNRLLRHTKWPSFKEGVVYRKIKEWRKQNPTLKEVGGICIVNEMQVLRANGWAHV